MTTQTLKQVAQGTSVSLATTELNGLTTTGSGSAASPVTNAVGQANLDGNPNATFRLHLGAPQGGAWTGPPNGIAFWWLRTENSVLETAPPSIAGGRPPDFYCQPQAISGAHDIVKRIRVPVGVLTLYWIADTTGRTAAATGNTASMTLDTSTMQ